MRTILLFAVAVALVAANPKDDNKKEIERFRGSWKFESVEFGGMPMDVAEFKDVRLVLKGENFSVKLAGVEYAGTFKVDVSKKPKTIDITYTEGPQKGMTLLGIYELEGDTYKICVSMVEKDRPKEFATKEGTQHVLQVLKREKR